MDDPVKEVEGVILRLTQGSPSVQRQTIEKYFLNNASFQHPFCRTGSFDGSRFLIRAIYRWYKIMSPRIDLKVNSIAYDSTNLILYVGISQVFQIWFIPIFYAPVNLTTVLRLKHDKYDGKYYLQSQDDLYQVNEFVKFFFPGGTLLVWFWQMFATLQCALLAVLFWPISWLEEHGDMPGKVATEQRKPFQSGKRAIDDGRRILHDAKEDAVDEIRDYRNGDVGTPSAF